MEGKTIDKSVVEIVTDGSRDRTDYVTSQLWKSSLIVVGTGQTIDKSVVEIVTDSSRDRTDYRQITCGNRH